MTSSLSMSSITSAVDLAIKRAESRASVLNRLNRNYGDDTRALPVTQSHVAEKNNSLVASRAAFDDAVCNVIQDFISDSRDRTKRQISDGLSGKSIVLNNVNTQSEAMKASRRSRR